MTQQSLREKRSTTADLQQRMILADCLVGCRHVQVVIQGEIVYPLDAFMRKGPWLCFGDLRDIYKEGQKPMKVRTNTIGC